MCDLLLEEFSLHICGARMLEEVAPIPRSSEKVFPLLSCIGLALFPSLLLPLFGLHKDIYLFRS